MGGCYTEGEEGTKQEGYSQCNPMWKVVEVAEFVFSFEPFTFIQVYTSLPEQHLHSLSPPKAICMSLIKPSIYSPAVRGWLLLFLKRIFVKIKTLHTKMHYKMAISDIIKLPGIFVFLAQRKRWNFELLMKAWGLGTLPRIPRRQPAQRWALARHPDRSQLPQLALPREAAGGDKSLGSPLPFPPHFPSSQLGVFEAILSSCRTEDLNLQALDKPPAPISSLFAFYRAGDEAKGGASDEPPNSEVQPLSLPPPNPSPHRLPHHFDIASHPPIFRLGQLLNQRAPPSSQRVTAL